MRASPYRPSRSRMTERGTSLQLKASVNWRAILFNALRLIRGWLKLIFCS
jgi:hypothetical protein